MTGTAPVSFAALLTRPETVRRAGKVALIVGTILVAINQGDLLLAGMLPPFWQIMLTYLVPYCVSSYSSAALWQEIAQKTDSGDTNGNSRSSRSAD